MSQKDPTTHEKRQLRYGCPVCEAKGGEWCTTKSGVAAAYLHAKRPSRYTAIYQ